MEFIKQLGRAIHSVNSTKNTSHHLELIYVIPAPHSQNLAEYDFGSKDLEELSDSVDGFSLMTYDFSGPQNPGPNAPLSWIHSSMQLLLSNNNEGGIRSHAYMIFLGINLYGNDFILSKGLLAKLGLDIDFKINPQKTICPDEHCDTFLISSRTDCMGRLKLIFLCCRIFMILL